MEDDMSGEITIHISELDGIKEAAKLLVELQNDISNSISQVDFGRLKFASAFAVDKINSFTSLCDNILITQEVQGFGEAFPDLDSAATNLFNLKVRS